MEASPYDHIWGIGLLETDPRALHPQSWLGDNLLGFILMQARQELRSRRAAVRFPVQPIPFHFLCWSRAAGVG